MSTHSNVEIVLSVRFEYESRKRPRITSLYMFCSFRKIASTLGSRVVPSMKSTLTSLRWPKCPQVCRIAVRASRCVGADITITTSSISLPRFGQRSGIGTVWPTSYMARAESLRIAIGADLVALAT